MFINIDQKVIYLVYENLRCIFTQRNKMHCSILRKLNRSRETSLSEFLSQTELVSRGHADRSKVKINVYTLFIKRAKRVEIKLSLFYFKSFQYQKFSHPVRRDSRLRSRVIFRCRRFSLFYTDLFLFFVDPTPPLAAVVEYILAVEVNVSLPNEMVPIFRRIYIYCAKPFIPNETLTSIPIKTHNHTHINILVHHVVYIYIETLQAVSNSFRLFLDFILVLLNL